MARLQQYMRTQRLMEAAYAQNLGFEEMVRFMQAATDAQIALMEKVVEADDWEGFKKLVKKVIGVSLK